MRLVAPVVALAGGLALTVGLWAWLGRPASLPDVPGQRLDCLSYAPSSRAGSPLDAREGVYFIPPGLIEADLAALRRLTGCVRIYSSLGGQGDVVPAAAAAGMQVLLGIWIGADETHNAREIERALSLAHAHPQAVRALVVGNEVLLRREMSGERLAGIVRAVRARTHLPVAYADIYEFWRRNPVVAEAVDVILLHVLPYWDDPHPVSIDRVQEHVRKVVARARATLPPKRLEIGEIGWPSAGRTRSSAAPGRINQARFVREFAVQSETLGVPYNLIEAIDQPWKRVPEGTVGGFWGVLDVQRQPKFPLAGSVSEWPHWHRAGVFTSAVVLGAFAWAAVAGSRLALWRWLALSGVAPALGATLWALEDQVAATAIWAPGWIWGGVLLGLAGLGGALLLGVLVGAQDGRLASPAPLDALWQRTTWHRPLRPGVLTGSLGAATMVSAAIVALLVAVDGRHRDFPTLAYWPPAAALLLLWLRGRKRRTATPASAPPIPAPHHPATREALAPQQAWLAALLLLCAPFAIDHPANREAWAWAVCCVALALPGLGLVRAEVGRLVEALRAAGQHQPSQHQGYA